MILWKKVPFEQDIIYIYIYIYYISCSNGTFFHYQESLAQLISFGVSNGDIQSSNVSSPNYSYIKKRKMKCKIDYQLIDMAMNVISVTLTHNK
jgi:hypothetical protein